MKVAARPCAGSRWGRHLFPRIGLEETATKAEVEALSAYHERRDPVRKVGLGPERDWSSHAADAFGLMRLAYEEPPANRGGRVVKLASEGVSEPY